MFDTTKQSKMRFVAIASVEAIICVTMAILLLLLPANVLVARVCGVVLGLCTLFIAVLLATGQTGIRALFTRAGVCEVCDA